MLVVVKESVVAPLALFGVVCGSCKVAPGGVVGSMTYCIDAIELVGLGSSRLLVAAKSES